MYLELLKNVACVCGVVLLVGASLSVLLFFALLLWDGIVELKYKHEDLKYEYENKKDMDEIV